MRRYSLKSWHLRTCYDRLEIGLISDNRLNAAQSGFDKKWPQLADNVLWRRYDLHTDLTPLDGRSNANVINKKIYDPDSTSTEEQSAGADLEAVASDRALKVHGDQGRMIVISEADLENLILENVLEQLDRLSGGKFMLENNRRRRPGFGAGSRSTSVSVNIRNQLRQRIRSGSGQQDILKLSESVLRGAHGPHSQPRVGSMLAIAQSPSTSPRPATTPRSPALVPVKVHSIQSPPAAQPGPTNDRVDFQGASGRDRDSLRYLFLLGVVPTVVGSLLAAGITPLQSLLIAAYSVTSYLYIVEDGGRGTAVADRSGRGGQGEEELGRTVRELADRILDEFAARKTRTGSNATDSRQPDQLKISPAVDGFLLEQRRIRPLLELIDDSGLKYLDEVDVLIRFLALISSVGNEGGPSINLN